MSGRKGPFLKAHISLNNLIEQWEFVYIITMHSKHIKYIPQKY